MTTVVLPLEILDLIVDHLHGGWVTLEVCCPASKIWVSRAQRHLFARVEFASPRHIESWKELFPDPSISLARHTRTLVNQYLDVIAPKLDVATWIHHFHHITELELNHLTLDHEASLIQLHGLSPTLTSLLLYEVYAPIPDIFNLICSFPLLKNLALGCNEPEGNTHARDIPSSSPKFTGSLDLASDHYFTRALSRLPGGLHFSKITVLHRANDWETAMELVSRCSDTLESLAVDYSLVGSDRYITPPPFDLSGFPKLKEVEFRIGHSTASWVTATLEAGVPASLQRIVISHTHMSWNLTRVEQDWGDLDRLLASLWSSRSILPEIRSRDRLKRVITQLLPELTSMRVVFKDRGSDD